MKIIGALFLFSLFAATSCQVVREQAAAGVESKVGETISAQLPVEKRAEFDAKWATDKSGAVKFASEAIGVDKLSAALVKADANNAELAADLQARGVDAAKDRWLELGLAGISAVIGATGIAKRNKWAGIADTMIHGVQGFLKQGPEGNAELMASIKSSAIANGNKHVLDAVVGASLAKIGEKPIVDTVPAQSAA